MIDFDENIQEQIDFLKGETEYLETDKELREDIKNKNPSVEAFQKNNLKKKIEYYKKSIELYKKALISNGSEKLNLVREAAIAELEGTNKYDLSYIETNINTWSEDIKEQFETFKKDF